MRTPGKVPLSLRACINLCRDGENVHSAMDYEVDCNVLQGWGSSLGCTAFE